MAQIDKQELRRVLRLMISQHIGFENRIFRHALVDRAAVHMQHDISSPGRRDYFDRVCREAIEDDRKTDAIGAAICSTQDDHGGYYMAANDKEFDDHLAVEETRGLTIIHSVQTRRRLRGMASPAQVRMPLDTPEKEPAYS